MDARLASARRLVARTGEAALSEECSAPSLAETKLESYPTFLRERRLLMAEYIRRYYESL